MNENIKFSKVIPAHPGLYMLGIYGGKDDYPAEFYKTYILAWTFDADNDFKPYPITIEGVETHTPAILQPDGTVSDADGSTWDDVDAWLKSMQDDHKSLFPTK